MSGHGALGLRVAGRNAYPDLDVGRKSTSAAGERVEQEACSAVALSG